MKKILLPVLAMVAVASCSQNDESSFTMNDREVRISSSIATRMSNDTWAENDAIGVYMVAADGDFAAAADGNVKYTTPDETGSFTSETPFYFPATGKVDLLAYYPYDATTVVTDYAVNVADQTAPAKIDLMKAAANDVGVSLSAVGMTFDHKLARIVLNISAGDGMTADDLKGLVVKLSGTSTTADYDLTTDAVDNHGDVADITLQTTTDSESGVVTAAEAIVIPQTLSGAKLIVETKDDQGATINTYEAAIATASFAVGKVYTYKMVIKGAEVKISSSNINSWTPDEDTSDDNLNAELVIPTPPSTELTLATVDETKIGEYEDTWVITDENVDGELSSSNFSNLKNAVAAANDAEREITIIFSNLKIFPNYALRFFKACKVQAPVVEEIGKYVFQSSAIKSFEIPASVTNMDIFAFDRSDNEMVVTSKHSNYVIESGVLYEVDSNTLLRGFNAMFGEGEISLRAGASITNYAFEDCTALKTVDLNFPAAVGTNAFSGCTQLTAVTNLNDADDVKVAAIESNTFNGCSSLGTIDLTGVTKIGEQAFYECSGLGSVTGFGDVETIHMSVFDNCTNLATIDLSNVGTIDKDAFNGCSALNNVVMDNVRCIYSNAFYGCNSLTSITLGMEMPGPMQVYPDFAGNISESVTLTLNNPIYNYQNGFSYIENIQVDGESNQITYEMDGSNHSVQFDDIVVDYHY